MDCRQRIEAPVEIGGHTFHGVCLEDVAYQSGYRNRVPRVMMALGAVNNVMSRKALPGLHKDGGLKT